MELKSEIAQEIARVQNELKKQKKLIKQHVGNVLMVETAEQEMKALHTRLSVLVANLAKMPD